jgi:hypothetical protein
MNTLSVQTAILPIDTDQNRPLFKNPLFMLRVGILFALVVMMLYGQPVYAQGGPLGDVVNNLVEQIVSLVQSVAVGLGIMGLVLWAVAKLARPIFPQIAGIAANYIPDLLIGLAFIFVATEIVEAVAGAFGG